VTYYGINNPHNTLGVVKAAHGSGPPAHFPESPFKEIGGSQFSPERHWTCKEGKELLQILFDGGSGLGPLGSPLFSPEQVVFNGFFS